MADDPADILTIFANAALATTSQGLRMSQRISELAGGHSFADNTPVAALSFLWLNRSTRPKDLAEALALTTGGATKVVDRFESAGLVTRVPLVEDARGVVVELTPKGKEVAEAVLRAVGPVLFDLADDLERLRSAASQRRETPK